MADSLMDYLLNLRERMSNAKKLLTDDKLTSFFFVTLPEALPIAVINADKTTADIGETITFDCLDSIDYQDSNPADDDTDPPAIVACHWDFGDGETDDGTTVTHEYDEAGTFTVTLTVEDNDATTDDDTLDVNILEEEEEEEEERGVTLEDLMATFGEYSALCCALILILLVLLYVNRDRLRM